MTVAGTPEPPVFVVRQDAFEGTLGELAWALRKGTLEPATIDLVDLVQSYLSHFDSLAERDLDLASAALPHVAQIIELKLRLLLPRPPREAVDGEEDEILEETLEAVALLEELEDAIDFLRQRRDQRRIVLPAQTPRPEYPRARRPLATGVGELAKLASRYRPGGYFEMAVDRLTISGAMKGLLERLKRWGRGRLRDLLDEPEWPQLTVHFAGMLELVREGRVLARQTEPYGEIELEPLDRRGAVRAREAAEVA